MEYLVVKLDSAKGQQWDDVLATQDMNTLEDYSYLPTRPRVGLSGDKIDIDWTNTDGRIWGLTVIWQSL